MAFSSLIYCGSHCNRVFSCLSSCMFASVPLCFVFYALFLLCELRARRNTFGMFSVSGHTSNFLLADCLSVVFLGFASQGCTGHWNGLLQGFAESALRSSQHIISQSITSHNDIAPHHVTSLYITSHDSTSITSHRII